MANIDVQQKELLSKAITPDMMSSEEEREDEEGCRYFEVKKPLWRTKKFQKLIDKIDRLYNESSSKRAKEQMLKRTVGAFSARSPPKTLDYGYDLFISKGL